MNPPDDAPTGHAPEKSYSAGELAAMVDRCRAWFEHLAEVHPELSIVHDEFRGIVRHIDDPLGELEALFSACAGTFVALKHLLNPTGFRCA